MRQIRLIPYCKTSQGWTLPDDDVLSLFDRMEKDDTVTLAFPDGKVSTRESFLSEMQGHNFLYGVMDMSVGQWIMFGWLNRFKKTSAFFHICAFKNIWGHPDIRGLTDWFVQRLLRFREKESDKYLLDVLFGRILKKNQRAVCFARGVATRELGETFFCNQPAVLFSITRQGNRRDYEGYYEMRD